jgi:hypothetical protein
VEIIARNAVTRRIDPAEHRCMTGQGTAWHHGTRIPRDSTGCGKRVNRGCIRLLKRIRAAAIDGKEQNPAALRVTLRALHVPIVPMETCKPCADITSLA